MSNPVSKQPGGGAGDLYPYHNNWNNTLFGSAKPISRCLYACCCGPCFVGQLADRVGDNKLVGCLCPSVLGSMRTKVRTAYKIQGSLFNDCLVTSCCVNSCAALQIENELNHRGVPAQRPK